MPANIAGELQSLPLEYMLSAPLTAVIKAQALAAKTTIDFIEKVGLEEDTAGNMKVRTAQFTYSAPVADPNNPGAMLYQDAELTVPLLAMLPIPYIRASDLRVTFEFKIRDVQSAASQSEITGKTGIDSTSTVQGKFGGGLAGLFGGPSGSFEQKTNFSMSVSSSRKSDSSSKTDRSATFNMTMNAVQDEIPSGLAKVLNILTEAIHGTKK
ncbi:MAG: DUF2589 domain-containing protein [Magnetococcus sp. YQC-3]